MRKNRLYKLILAFTGLLSCTLITAQTDTSLLRRYHEERRLVKFYSYQDSVRMYEHGEKAIALIRQLNKPVLEAEIRMSYANHYFFQTDYERARKLYNEAEQIALKYGNDTLQNIIRVKYGFMEHELGHWNESKKIYDEIMQASVRTNDTAAMIEAINGIASLKEKQGKNDEALALYNTGLRIAQKAKRSYQYAYLLNNRALLNMKLNFNKRAREDLEEALKLAGEDRLKGNVLNNIGLIWMGERKLDTALLYFNQFYALAKDYNLPEWLVVSLINISSIKATKGKIDEAIRDCDSALRISERHGNIYYIPKILNALSDLSGRKKNYRSAIDYAKKSLEASAKAQSLEDIPMSWSILAQTYEGLNDHKNAYDAMQKYKIYDDSLRNLSSEKRFNELLVQYDVEKKEKAFQEEKNKVEIMNKERELEASRVRSWFILLASLAVIVSGILYILYIRKTRKQQERFSQQLIESIEGERSRIAKELHDDIGANLSIVKNKIFIQSEKDKIEFFSGLSADISHVIEQTRSISHQLYPSYLYKLGTGEAIVQFLKRVERDTSLTVQLVFDPSLESDFTPFTKMHVFRIIQELVNNTIKHADASNIRLEISREGSDRIQMVYSDDGKGMKDSNSGGIGMTSMRERVKMLGGKMKIEEEEKGCRISFIFSTTKQ